MEELIFLGLEMGLCRGLVKDGYHDFYVFRS
jgi:hypothetical protein